jgi:hypothetical protein
LRQSAGVSESHEFLLNSHRLQFRLDGRSEISVVPPPSRSSSSIVPPTSFTCKKP